MRSRARVPVMVVVAALLLLLPMEDARGEPMGQGHPVELGAYTGFWAFDSSFRVDSSALLGLRAGLGFFSWLNVEVSLEAMRSNDRIAAGDIDVTTVSMHGRVEPWNGWRLSPARILGVSFMAFDQSIDLDAVSEGLDLGLGGRLRVGSRISVLGEILFRSQPVKRRPLDELGRPISGDEQTEHLWSEGFRLGVAIAL